MRVALVSFGSRGDLEPLVALALELKRRGFDPYIVANSEIKDIAASYDIASRPLTFSIKQLLLEEKSEQMLASKSSSKSLKILSSIILENLYSAGIELADKTTDADLIIINERYYLLGQTIKEKNKTKLLQICFQPKGSTNAYPYLYFSSWSFAFYSNRKTHEFVDRMLLKKFLPVINELRKQEFHLPELSLNAALSEKHETTMLEGFSPALFTQPKDWKNNLIVTGSWSLKNPNKDIPPELKKFLNSPLKKVYVGFGSMIYSPEKLSDLLSSIAKKLNIQIVWTLNWSESQKLKPGLFNKNIFLLKECNHDEIFPLVDLVIHHGGAGTVAAAARNAKPQGIAWFMLDQHFWARQINELEIGMNLGSFHQLKEDQISKHINKLLYEAQYSKNTQTIAQKMKEENGPKTAVDVIEKL